SRPRQCAGRRRCSCSSCWARPLGSWSLILTFAFGVADDSGLEPSAVSAVSYSKGQVFGFLLLVCGTAGVALGGIVALVLEWTVGRRTRRVRVDRESVTTVE